MKIPFQIGDKVIFHNARSSYQNIYMDKIGVITEVIDEYKIRVHFDNTRHSKLMGAARFRHLSKLERQLK